MTSRIYLSPPHVGQEERELLLEAFDSNWLAPLGPQVDRFEAEFCSYLGSQFALATSSGTAALHLALLAVGVGPGDVVLTSTLTFVASTNAIRYVGATPVFIDSETKSWNLDPNLLEDELKRRARDGTLPKAAVVVDICGQAADWEPIRELCSQFGVIVIEDAAEALGASYRGRAAGTLGDIGCFSFNGNKIITTSGGGMLVSENQQWVAKARHLASQARDAALHYEHTVQGYNYRLSNLLAAVGRAQLARLETRVAQRRLNFDKYRIAFKDLACVEFMPEASEGRATRWLTCLTLDPSKTTVSPAQVISDLADDQIEARPMWKPMHLQPLFAGFPCVGGAVSQRLFEQGLCLPSGSCLSDDDHRRVSERFRASVLGTIRSVGA